MDAMAADALYGFYDYGDGNYTDNMTLIHMYYMQYSSSDGSLFSPEEMRRLIPVAIFYSLAFLLGVVGNTLVIYCIAKYKRMQSITNQLLLSLACADLLLTLVCVPIKFAELFSYGWGFGEMLCKTTHFVQVWSMITSIMTLTTISLERYYAISRPLRAKYLCTTNHVRAVILSIWLVSCFLAVPVLFVQEHHMTGIIEPVYWCEKRWDVKGRLVAVCYEVYMLCVLFLLPVIIMACAYCGVCIELWAVTGDIQAKPYNSRIEIRDESADLMQETVCTRNTSTSSKLSDDLKLHQHEKTMRKTHSREAQIRRQVLHMLITVVAIFILCWGPLLCYNLAVASGAVLPYFPLEYPYHRALDTAFSLLAYCNSCLNPLVYGFMSRYFRKSFKQAIASCCILNTTYHSYLQTPIHNERSFSCGRKLNDPDLADQTNKPNTTTITGADSTLSRSPPLSPDTA